MKSIKSKLIVWFTMCMSVILITISFLNYHVSKSQLKKELEMEEMMNAESIAYNIDRNVKSAEKIADTVAQMSEQLIYDQNNYINTKEYLTKTLSNILKTNDDLETIYTFFKPEMQISQEMPYVCILRGENKKPEPFETDKIEEFPYWEMDWYQLGKTSGNFDWTEPYLEEATGRTLISGVKKLKNGEDEYIGVAGMDFHLKKIESIMEKIELKEGGFSFLVSNKGTYIYHPNKEYTLKKNIHDEDDPFNKLVENIEKNEEGYQQIKYKNKDYYVFYHGIESSKWTVGIAYPADILTKELQKNFLLNMGALMVGILLIISISAGLSKILFKSIELGLKTSRALAQGDLTNKIEVNIEDEIGNLVKEIDGALQGLRKILIDVNVDTENLEEISGELTIVNKDLVSKSNHIIEQVKAVQQNISIEGANIHSVYGNFEEVASFTEEINLASQENVKKTIQSVKAVESTKQIIEASINQLDKVIKLVEFAVGAIQRLEQRAEQIESTLGLIRNISKQTNLLALNASIEAARAGELGKGFAVVADEIRKLAEQSSETVDKIEKLINDINVESNETLASMDTDVKETTAQLENIKDTQANLDDILLNLHNFVEVSKGLDQMIKEQAKATASAKDSMMTISNSTEKIEFSIEDIGNATLEQEEIVKKVEKNSEELHNISQKLKNSIARFKIKEE
ncbi:MAG: methyl-accepting chemotaxis protein [Marinisporobacter sp.]|nr:methyl-accepting chemotaxis protein [Marinisporobacter sp.]